MKFLLLTLGLLFATAAEAKPKKPDVEIVSQAATANTRTIKMRVNVRRTVEVQLDCGDEFYSVTPIVVTGPRRVSVELSSSTPIPECQIASTQELPADYPKEDEVAFAAYGQESYEGFAFVLFEKDGKLFINEGSHCSCNGLERSWSPSEVSWKYLEMRIWQGYQDETVAALRQLVAEKSGESLEEVSKRIEDDRRTW